MRTDRRGRGAWLLVELMLAVLFTGMVVAALYKSFETAIVANRGLVFEREGAMVADAEVRALLEAGSLASGVREGERQMGERTWRWKTTVTALPPARLWRVEVEARRGSDVRREVRWLTDKQP